ncbi:MAG: hypothetical protein JXR47_01435 [Thiotrichales bacterium]|nr:hypothetical protein [Thiotrichales bacterium]
MAVTIEDNYTAEDFKQAAQKLLPPGEYWSNQTPGTDLDKLFTAIGQELKTVHDETKLSVLIQLDNSLFGWKIADYQGLLNLQGIDAQVTDDPLTPNVIYIKIRSTQDLLAVFKQIENYRLPHTIINWGFEVLLGMKAALRGAVYKRIEAIEAPYLGGVGLQASIRPINYLRLEASEA